MKFLAFLRNPYFISLSNRILWLLWSNTYEKITSTWRFLFNILETYCESIVRLVTFSWIHVIQEIFDIENNYKCKYKVLLQIFLRNFTTSVIFDRKLIVIYDYSKKKIDSDLEMPQIIYRNLMIFSPMAHT